MRYRINRRPTSKRPLSARWRMINRARSWRTRARGEHAFRIVKQLWGFAKVRYRTQAKNYWHGRRPCLRWLISTRSATTAPGRREMYAVNAMSIPSNPARPLPAQQPLQSSHLQRYFS